MGDFSSENCPAFGPHLDERDLSTRPTVWSGKGKASQREEVWLSIVRDIGSPRSRRLICYIASCERHGAVRRGTGASQTRNKSTGISLHTSIE